jgi:flap endonuclease-1
MGVDLGPLVKQRTKITLEQINGLVVAIDAYNALYQFLAIIRGEGGELLMDTHGNVTSHLSGLFYRTVNMLENGCKPLYVFDGRPPDLKMREVMRRDQIKKNAEAEYKVALERGDVIAARKYASMTSRLTSSMVQDAKSLLTLMGVPWVQAPSEGEAEASYLTLRGIAWATVSQDYDSLLFGSPTLLRNLTVSGRRKLPGKGAYIEVYPEIIRLEDVLRFNGLTREQLVDVGILLGTDFNPEGFNKVGPATALKYIKNYGKLENIPEIRQELSKLDYNAIREIFLHPNVKDIEPPEWKPADKDGITKFLCDLHDFSLTRVSSAIARIANLNTEQSSTLERWF